MSRLSWPLAILLAAATAAHSESVPLPVATNVVTVAVLDSARDQGAWRLGTVRYRFPQPVLYGAKQADGGEDEFAFDCATGTYAYARRTLTLAGVVVDERGFPEKTWASSRAAASPAGSVPALALERFCALKDVPRP